MGDAADDCTDNGILGLAAHRAGECEGLCPYCEEEAPPECPHCGPDVEPRCIDSAEIYGGLSYGMVWVCGNYPTCGCRIGCHKGTKIPMGRFMADNALRRARMLAHKSFDPIWQTGRMPRKKAYEWLSRNLKIPRGRCHIGQMNVQQCELVVEFCTGWMAQMREIRAKRGRG